MLHTNVLHFEPNVTRQLLSNFFCLHVSDRHSIRTFTRQTVTASDTTVKQLQHTHHRRLRHEKKDDTPENNYEQQQAHGERAKISVHILTSPWLKSVFNVIPP